MPDQLASKVDALKEEAHDVARATNRRTRWIIALLAVVLMVGCVNGYGIYRIGRAARDAKAAALGVAGQTAIFADALNPQGCIAKSSQYASALRAWEIENDNRRIHDAKLLDPPKAPAKCKIPSLPKPTPTKTVIVPGPTRTVTITRTVTRTVVRCVRPNGRAC